MRPDQEKYQQAVLNIKKLPDDEPIEVSWLRWYQALALADTGDKEAATQLAQRNIVEDAQVGMNHEYWEVGRRQYVMLKRFIEYYSPYFRDLAIVGIVAQVIQSSSGTNR